MIRDSVTNPHKKTRRKYSKHSISNIIIIIIKDCRAGLLKEPPNRFCASCWSVARMSEPSGPSERRLKPNLLRGEGSLESTHTHTHTAGWLLFRLPSSRLEFQVFRRASEFGFAKNSFVASRLLLCALAWLAKAALKVMWRFSQRFDQEEPALPLLAALLQIQRPSIGFFQSDFLDDREALFNRYFDKASSSPTSTHTHTHTHTSLHAHSFACLLACYQSKNILSRRRCVSLQVAFAFQGMIRILSSIVGLLESEREWVSERDNASCYKYFSVKYQQENIFISVINE